MIPLLLYWLLIIVEFIFVITAAFYMLFLIYSSVMGAPYVPSKKKLIVNILQEIPLTKKTRFLDLGCGDGRVVIAAAKEYKLKAVGIDINPMIIAWAKIKARLTKVTAVEFRVANIFKTDLKNYDIIFMFLMPQLLIKLKPKLQQETKKKALLISHGFKIDGWDKYCFRMLKGRPFNTYLYHLR